MGERQPEKLGLRLAPAFDVGFDPGDRLLELPAVIAHLPGREAIPP